MKKKFSYGVLKALVKRVKEYDKKAKDASVHGKRLSKKLTKVGALHHADTVKKLASKRSRRYNKKAETLEYGIRKRMRPHAPPHEWERRGTIAY